MANSLVRYGGRAAGIVLISVLTIPLLHGDTIPSGEILQPRLGEVLIPASQVIRFSGWVDFPGTSGVITISVRTGTDTWTNVANVTPSASGSLVGGVTRYNWIYSPTRTQLLSSQAWPEGGTARVKVRAFRFSGGSAYLRVLDGSLTRGNNDEIVLADPDPTPTEQGPVDSPDYLNKKDVLTQIETSRYYQSVGTDPHGSGTSIASAFPTLESFKRHYFEASCHGPEYTATYFNKGDLGLGREMHCVGNPCTRETACYVKNYGNPDGTPIFDDVDKAAAAVQAHKPFATVAMVERGDMDLRAANKVFFAVYDHQRLRDQSNPDSAPLSYQAPLDNKGYNKSIPTNCLVCHGVSSTYTKSSPTAPFNAKVKGAYFLPFDLSSFAFFSTSASNPLSRPKQEAAFKGLNTLVYFTDLWFNGDANELLDGWYGGAAWSSPTFHGSFVPDGWRNTSNATDDGNRKALYLNVVAKSCRTCHISHTLPDDILAGRLTFGSFDQLKDNRVAAYTDVCTTHAMPNAEQSLKEFWSSPARAHFLNRLGLDGDCNVQRRKAPSGVAKGTATLTATVSALAVSTPIGRYALDTCNCTTRDCLNAVDDQYLREVAVTPPAPGSEPAITAMMREASQCRERVLGAGGIGAAMAPSSEADRLFDRERERSQRSGQTP